MKKYFIVQRAQLSEVKISRNEIQSYRELLIKEMIRMGATDSDLNLICDVTIRNSIIKHRKPEDVAWAMLQ